MVAGLQVSLAPRELQGAVAAAAVVVQLPLAQLEPAAPEAWGVSGHLPTEAVPVAAVAAVQTQELPTRLREETADSMAAAAAVVAAVLEVPTVPAELAAKVLSSLHTVFR